MRPFFCMIYTHAYPPDTNPDISSKVILNNKPLPGSATSVTTVGSIWRIYGLHCD